jgi:inhibitor of KinA sporulation pathway (predicted exonuclease)
MKRLMVVDLEATCWREEPPRGERSEIIEIGGVILEAPDGRWEVYESFGILVKPVMSLVSPYCEELTGITQKAVMDYGVSFAEAMDLIAYDNVIAWASWGAYDYHKLNESGKFFDVRLPLPRNHINVKALYSAKYMKGGRGLKRALKELGMAFEGRHHRGEDDALNVAKVLQQILNGG